MFCTLFTSSLMYLLNSCVVVYLLYIPLPSAVSFKNLDNYLQAHRVCEFYGRASG